MSQEQQQSNDNPTRNPFSQAQNPIGSHFVAPNPQLHHLPASVLQQGSQHGPMNVPNPMNQINVLNSNGEQIQSQSEMQQILLRSATAGATNNAQNMQGWMANHVIPTQNGSPYQFSTAGLSPQGQIMSAMVSTPDQAQVPFVPELPQTQKKSSKPARKKSKSDNPELSEEAKAQQNRERNREHARSTRLRKKAYVQQLKEMADGLREIQTTEIRQRRMAVQKMMDVKKSRRTLVQTVLAFHATYESDPDKWRAVVEESFWFKQPVTPFRSFRRSEVEKVSGQIHYICLRLSSS